MLNKSNTRTIGPQLRNQSDNTSMYIVERLGIKGRKTNNKLGAELLEMQPNVFRVAMDLLQRADGRLRENLIFKKLEFLSLDGKVMVDNSPPIPR